MQPTTSSLATGASAGSAGMLCVILVWIMSEWGVPMPTEVALAFSTLLAPIFHLFYNIVTNRLIAAAEKGGRRVEDGKPNGGSNAKVEPTL